jgi:hypothetical protein
MGVHSPSPPSPASADFSVEAPPRIYQERESVSWTLHVTEHKTSNGTKLYKRLQGQESILKQSKHSSIAGQCRGLIYDQKPNSWTYNHVEVSGHNQTWGFCMDFKTIGKGVWFSIRFSSFLLYRNCKRLREFREIEISSKAAQVTVNNKGKNS